MTISARRSPHVELYFHVLSHLDLDRDAASLYVRRKGRAPAWVAPLLDAYRAAPGRLYAHVLPLHCDDVEAMGRLLRAGAMPGLNDGDGRALCAHLADALDAERAAFEQRWQPEPIGETTAYLIEHLSPLRARLWEPAGKAAPDLHIEAVDALTSGEHSHARATGRGGRRIVAVSFRPAREQILCQVLHEEIHPVTDPPIRARYTAAQDTRAGSAGYELHAELERAAVDRGQQLLEDCAPGLLPAYATWRARYRM